MMAGRLRNCCCFFVYMREFPFALSQPPAVFLFHSLGLLIPSTHARNAQSVILVDPQIGPCKTIAEASCDHRKTQSSSPASDDRHVRADGDTEVLFADSQR